MCQVVTAIVTSIPHDFFTGDRYILDDGKKLQIIEYVGDIWKTYEINSITPIYIKNAATSQQVIVYHDKIWTTKKYFICDVCAKIYPNTLQTNTSKCVHCYFVEIYDNPEQDNLKNNPMTISQYIKTYNISHKSYTCMNPSKCFLCDYKNGKLLFGLRDAQTLYGDNMLQLLQTKKLTIVV